jgi:hypothetical protein
VQLGSSNACSVACFLAARNTTRATAEHTQVRGVEGSRSGEGGESAVGRKNTGTEKSAPGGLPLRVDVHALLSPRHDGLKLVDDPVATGVELQLAPHGNLLVRQHRLGRSGGRLRGAQRSPARRARPRWAPVAAPRPSSADTDGSPLNQAHDVQVGVALLLGERHL